MGAVVDIPMFMHFLSIFYLLTNIHTVWRCMRAGWLIDKIEKSLCRGRGLFLGLTMFTATFVGDAAHLGPYVSDEYCYILESDYMFMIATLSSLIAIFGFIIALLIFPSFTKMRMFMMTSLIAAGVQTSFSPDEFLWFSCSCLYRCTSISCGSYFFPFSGISLLLCIYGNSLGCL